MSSQFTVDVANTTIEIIDCLSTDGEMQTGISIFNYLLDVREGELPRIRRHKIRSLQEFWDCLDKIESDSRAGERPIIHFEGHANKDGFELSLDGAEPNPHISWARLVERLRDINIACEFNLGVFFAACEGIEALRSVTLKKAAPYIFLVGPNMVVTADLMKSTSEGFYYHILRHCNLNRAFLSLPQEFNHFLAERLFAKIYVRLLKRQNFGRLRKAHVESLVSAVLPSNATPETLKEVRRRAKLSSVPDRRHFESIQRTFLPLGVSFDFDTLVSFARTGELS